MWSSRVRDIAITAAVVILGFFAFTFLYARWKNRIIQEAKAKEHVEQLDTNRPAQFDSLRKADTIYLGSVQTYRGTRDRAIATNPSNPVIPARSCDQIILTCDQRQAASKAIIDSQQVEIDELKRLKKFALPRFSISAMGGYDVLAKTPVVQAQTEMHIAGALSAIAQLEAYRDSTVKLRGIVGGKITFR